MRVNQDAGAQALGVPGAFWLDWKTRRRGVSSSARLIILSKEALSNASWTPAAGAPWHYAIAGGGAPPWEDGVNGALAAQGTEPGSNRTAYRRGGCWPIWCSTSSCWRAACASIYYRNSFYLPTPATAVTWNGDQKCGWLKTLERRDRARWALLHHGQPVAQSRQILQGREAIQGVPGLKWDRSRDYCWSRSRPSATTASRCVLPTSGT